MTDDPHQHDEDAQHGHADAGHPPDLHHHFETHQQQFDAGKLGMWIFIVTELLLFSGLFIVYAVYRTFNPDVFQYSRVYLDVGLGTVNTLVLLFSSLTAAWAVRAAQLEQRSVLVACVGITILSAVVFLGIKAVEYGHKLPVRAHVLEQLDKANRADANMVELDAHIVHLPKDLSGRYLIRSQQQDADTAEAEAAHGDDMLQLPLEQAQNMAQFFGIYFVMTGLHALHVIAGMIAFGWIFFRARRGDFNRRYFGPVDYTALYWHVVDIVWIFLFPLLYLVKPETYI